jgi:hypothetical protein
MLNVTTLAYIAGLFDGEGYVGVHYNLRSHPERTNFGHEGFGCGLSITNRNLDCLKFVQRHFEGHINTNKKTGCYKWNLTGAKNITIFLNMLMPYLIVKKHQAYLTLGYLKTVRPVNLGNSLLEPAVRKARWWFLAMLQFEKDSASFVGIKRRQYEKTMCSSKIIETAGNPDRAISNEAVLINGTLRDYNGDALISEGIVRHSEESEINQPDVAMKYNKSRN